MPTSDTKYINIPYQIMYNKKLTDKEKMIYGLINGFWEGQFIASNEWIAKLLNTTPRTVQKLVTSLCNHKLISRRIVLKNGKVVGRQLIINKKKTKTEEDGWK